MHQQGAIICCVQLLHNLKSNEGEPVEEKNIKYKKGEKV